jgi:hypothetical protein
MVMMKHMGLNVAADACMASIQGGVDGDLFWVHLIISRCIHLKMRRVIVISRGDVELGDIVMLERTPHFEKNANKVFDVHVLCVYFHLQTTDKRAYSLDQIISFNY